jgi:hypothetical protein
VAIQKRGSAMLDQKEIASTINRLEPVIESVVRKYSYYPGCFSKYSKSFDIEDAKQEARIALIEALEKYDTDRGSIETFGYKVLNNLFCTLLSRFVRKIQSDVSFVFDAPHREKCVCCGGIMHKNSLHWRCISKDCEKYNVAVDCRNIYSEYRKFCGCVSGISVLDACGELIWLQNYEMLEEFESSLVDMMNCRERDVYFCLFDTNGLCPEDRLLMVITGKKKKLNCVSRELGLSVSQVSWCLNSIKKHFSLLAKSERFVDLYGDRSF